MAALLKVNTFQNASGGANTTYLTRPLANVSPAPTTKLTTGIWYTSQTDMMVVVNRAGTSNWCYYTIYMAGYPSSTLFTKLLNRGYSPYGSAPCNTIFLPKGMWFKVNNDYGDIPDIWMYKIGGESLTSL